MFKWLEPSLHATLKDPSLLAHALLVRGPKGIGKQAFGLALAQGLLCEKPVPGGIACGICNSCGWFANGTHPDFRMLAPPVDGEPAADGEDAPAKSKETKASPWISIEQVRELHDFIHVSSHRGGRKVIIVSPAEALNVAAANALLKSLEEPPPQTHFILISHRPHRLMRTIISRCRQLSLQVPALPVAASWLAEQGIKDPEVVLAQASGAPLLALEMVEGDELAGRREFLRTLAATDLDPLAAAETFRDLPMERFINWLQKWTCDIAEQRMLGRVRYNPDFTRELTLIAKRVEPLAALRLHRKLVREQRNIHHPLNARLYMESVFFAYSALLNPVRRAA
jgi:DNA polymerase-3 subunit delta'